MKKDTTTYGAIRPNWDRLDCSVRALATATGAAYEQASAIYSAAGRKLKQGTTLDTTQTVCETWLRMRRVDARVQLAVFIVLHPLGRFILHKRDHAFALVDGVVHDWEGTSKAGTEIEDAWEVTEETLARLVKLAELFN